MRVAKINNKSRNYVKWCKQKYFLTTPNKRKIKRKRKRAEKSIYACIKKHKKPQKIQHIFCKIFKLGLNFHKRPPLKSTCLNFKSFYPKTPSKFFKFFCRLANFFCFILTKKQKSFSKLKFYL